ncbi:MAG: hypothetical protein JJ863_03650 [Deltaproteobacteria bacterium]|nr:hypothetical protein [Deltaproteobacteria bacterium]
MISTSVISRLFLALALAGLFGCKQGRGDTCFEDNDCSGALVCCKATATATVRGVCLQEGEMCSDPPPEEIDMGERDPVDFGISDLGTEDDLGTADLGPEDGGPEDAGTEDDLGPEDGGLEDMGEADLGDEDAG